jgi:hypothetical protein
MNAWNFQVKTEETLTSLTLYGTRVKIEISENTQIHRIAVYNSSLTIAKGVVSFLTGLDYSQISNNNL